MLEKNKSFTRKDEEPEKKSDPKLMKEWRIVEKLFPRKENEFVKPKNEAESEMLRKLVIEAREREEIINNLLKKNFDKRYRPNASAIKKIKRR